MDQYGGEVKVERGGEGVKLPKVWNQNNSKKLQDVP